MERVRFSSKSTTKRAISRLLPILLALLMARSAVVQALGVGEIELHSVLNQQLDADISLLDINEEDLGNLQIDIAPNEDYARAGVERLGMHSQISFDLATRADGSPYIKVTSREPIREPFLDFIVAIDWSRGHVLREFTLLLDPPVLTEERPAPIAAAVTEAPAADTGSASVADVPPVPQAPSTQAAPPAVAPAVAPAPGSAGLVYGPTKRSDTLWSIAAKMRPDHSMSIPQMMMALLRENPEAFYEQNINGLKAGYILRVADVDGVKSMSRQAAEHEARIQNQRWTAIQGGGRVGKAPTGIAPESAPAAAGSSPAAATESEAQLKLIAPPAGGEIQAIGADAEQLSNKEQELAKIRQDLALAMETSDATQQENEDLQSRLHSLEEQIATMQRLIALKDDTLATLQNQLDGNQSGDLAAAVPDSGAAEPAIPATETAGETPATAAQEPPPTVNEIPGESQQIPPLLAAEPETAAPASFTQQVANRLLGNPLVSGIVVVVMLILMTLAWLIIRQRRLAALEETAIPYSLDQVDSEAAAEAEAVATEVAGEKESQADAEAFTAAGIGGAAAEVSEIDPLAEADVYVAYKRYQQAGDLLKGAIENDPTRLDLRMKLLEIYAMAEDRESFIAEAETLYTMIDDAGDPSWQQVLEAGSKLAPEHPLFSDVAGNVENNIVQLEAGSDDDLDIAVKDEFAAVDAALDRDGDEAPVVDLSEEAEIDAVQPDAVAVGDDQEEGLQSATLGDETDEATASGEGGEESHTIEFEAGLLSSDEPVGEEQPTTVADNTIEFPSQDAVAAGQEEEPGEGEPEVISLDSDEDSSQQEGAEAMAVSDDFGELAESVVDPGHVDAAEENSAEEGHRDSESTVSVANGTVVPLDTLGGHDGQQASAWIEEQNPPEDHEARDDQSAFVSEMTADPDVVATKLDLARAYIDMGDADGAKGILDEIMAEGNDNQKGEAQGLLSQLG